jgi:adenylosuccinate lyase
MQSKIKIEPENSTDGDAFSISGYECAMSDHDFYDNPLISRYASPTMARLFSPQARISTWRKLWVALAEAQQSLGLAITAEQIAALRSQVDTIDFAKADAYEKRFRHDVMAHVHALGDAAPLARAIIHLGATSCYVTDNADLILTRAALELVRDKTVGAIDALAVFAKRWRELPCLGYTHFQPAQLVTVGKRASLWCHELVLDLEEIERRLTGLKFLGAKGTTGTQASFLELFGGDDAKVIELDRRVAAAFNFSEVYPVSGQTYSRKIDAQVVATLGGIAESAHRFGSDLRLLAHEQEVEEPFESEQIGSSAMAYKRNPMRAERMCSLARFALALAPAAGQTAATQWLERTLDDSAIRRLVIPQAFLAVDGILNLYLNVAAGLVVHPAVIERHVAEQLPFMATENLLMAAAQAGGDRQDLHERIRVHAMAASEQLKQGAARNDLLDRIRNDPAFPRLDFERIVEPRRYTGRSARQVEEFIANVIEPIRARYPHRGEADPDRAVRV